MSRRPNNTRQTPSIENLESRQLLTGGVAPTAELQYMQEVVNLVRTQPRAAAERMTTNLSGTTRDTINYFRVDLNAAKRDIANAPTRQPLAWNDNLARAAQVHSQDMATKGYQDHKGSDGSWPDARMEQAGYTNRKKSAENAYAYGESVDQAMQAFTLDWGVADKGHLRNLTENDTANADDTFKEVGLGIVDSNLPGFGKVVTQNFGVRNDSPTYLLGVAYSDKDGDRFYSMGEGQGNVSIDVTDDSGRTVSTRTEAPGGYQIPLAPGRYTVKASLDGRIIRSQPIQIGSQNVKVDFDLSQPWSNTPVSTPAPAQTRPTVTLASRPTAPVAQPRATVTMPQATIARFQANPVRVVTPTPTPVVTPTPAPVVTPTPVVAQNVITASATDVQDLAVLDNSSSLDWSVWAAVPVRASR